MWAQPLPVNSRSRLGNNTTKYVVTCQDRISAATPSTNEWLTLVGTLKAPTQKDVHRVLEGILEKRKRVAVKLSASPSVYKEYKIAQELHDVPGFIRPLCYFECEDSYTEFPSKTKEHTALCRGPGTSMKVLVLPFLEEGSMRSCNWAKKPAAVLHACLLQCMCSLLQVYEAKGILHSDTHLDNVLLKKTTVGEVEYMLGGHRIAIPTQGYLIAIMDFELSLREMPTNRGRAIGQVYDDILHAVFDLRYNDSTDIVGDAELITALMALKTHPVDVYTAWQTLYPLVTKLRATPKVSRSFTYDPFVVG